MAKTVRVIPATMAMHTGRPVNSVAKRKVAGYARVSTDSDEQFTSYEAQVDYYTQMIMKRSDWEFVGVYTDEGITGTNTKHRDGFNRMIEDALSGKIDLIVTKSVSRFARNTVDSLTTVRKLKDVGVEVYFEKENIYTLDSKGELLITIMSSLAQEESRSISENVTWGKRKRFSDGVVQIPYGNFLGYEKGSDGTPVIVEAEAEIIVMIYDMFLSGMSTGKIAKELTERGVRTPKGNSNWSTGTIYSILQNEKYKGAALLQKTFTTDFLTKKHKINEGEVPQYYVEDSHPAIIDPRIWNLAQMEMARRGALGRSCSCCEIFSGRLFCSECGSIYGPKRWTTRSGKDRSTWRCAKKNRKGQTCDSYIVTEEELKEKFIAAFNEIYDDREIVMDYCRSLLGKLEDNTALDDEIKEHMYECEALEELSKKLIDMNASRKLDQEFFQDKYDDYVKRYEKESSRIEELKAEKADRLGKADQLSSFMFEIYEQDGTINEFDSKLWIATVESVEVQRDGVLVFRFRNGMEVSK